MEDSNEFDRWLATRPKSVRTLARKYPPGEYTISENAPYSITCSGTVVDLIGYRENGEVIVVVEPKNRLPAAVEHIRSILRPQGRDFAEVANTVMRVEIDPRYLIPYKPQKT